MRKEILCNQDWSLLKATNELNMPWLYSVSEHQLFTSLVSLFGYAAQLVQLLNLAKWFLLFWGVQLILQNCILLNTTVKVLCMGDMGEQGSWQSRLGALPVCTL